MIEAGIQAYMMGEPVLVYHPDWLKDAKQG
jgi:hypothetical protein